MARLSWGNACERPRSTGRFRRLERQLLLRAVPQAGQGAKEIVASLAGFVYDTENGSTGAYRPQDRTAHECRNLRPNSSPSAPLI